jgi:hypothetical protein
MRLILIFCFVLLLGILDAQDDVLPGKDINTEEISKPITFPDVMPIASNNLQEKLSEIVIPIELYFSWEDETHIFLGNNTTDGMNFTPITL